MYLIDAEWWMWAGLFLFTIFMLSIDVFLLTGKNKQALSTKEALGWVSVWVALAFLFNLLLWFYVAHLKGFLIANEKSLEFLTSYLIEASLSVDNMFVFIMLFNYLGIELKYQRRVLLFGVLGAITMRLLMIALGTFVWARFSWVFYLFGFFLLLTGIKMIVFSNKKSLFDKTPLIDWMKTHLRVSEQFHDGKFFIRKEKKIYVTHLFLALIFIEVSDLIFAIDSIPAVFAVTKDAFIIFSANVFSILGLRALYFLLRNVVDKFYFLKYGFALILSFMGLKMLIAPWLHIPIFVALAIVVAILVGSIVLTSLLSAKK